MSDEKNKKSVWEYYQISYEKTDLYCPKCGQQSVEVEASEGDYYLGPEYVCAKCECSFYHVSGDGSKKDGVDK